jgi:hypothetical protein
MTIHEILVQRQGIALDRAVKLAQGLSPLDKPLQQVAAEPLPSDVHVLTEVVRVALQVCSEQRGHIVELAERIELLERRGDRLPVEEEATAKK